MLSATCSSRTHRGFSELLQLKDALRLFTRSLNLGSKVWVRLDMLSVRNMRTDVEHFGNSCGCMWHPLKFWKSWNCHVCISLWSRFEPIVLVVLSCEVKAGLFFQVGSAFVLLWELGDVAICLLATFAAENQLHWSCAGQTVLLLKNVAGNFYKGIASETIWWKIILIQAGEHAGTML